MDVLTRLLADEEEKYDSVTPGKTKKRLYVEVTPLSFPIILYQGDPICQLRVAYGGFDQLQIQEEMLKLNSEVMRDKNGIQPVPGKEQTCLRLNLEPINTNRIDGLIAFKAKRFNKKQPGSLDPLHPNAKPGTYDPHKYWDIITTKDKNIVRIEGRYALRVQKNDFYILRSQERFTLPKDIAVYGIAMTEEVGELRIHHAGFIHPLFGRERSDKKGTPLAFEVRGHDMDMYLTDGDLMAKLRYYPMSEDYEKKKNDLSKRDYEEQELKLSKIFKEF